MPSIDASYEYAKILKKYLQNFGLETIDIAYLIGTKADVLDGIIEGKRGAVLKTLEKISNVFGLRYYEFGNPQHPLPALESLPEVTRARIAYRKKEGPHEKSSYDQRLLNEKIITLLSEYKKGDEFLAEDISAALKVKFRETVSTSEVTSRLSNYLNAFVVQTDKKDTSKTGKGRKPFYYRVINEVPESVFMENKIKISSSGKTVS